MAPQDHPRFEEWETKLFELNKAWEAVTQAAVQGDPRELAEKEALVIAAIRQFRDISDKLDA
jgi:hypothetical protein